MSFSTPEPHVGATAGGRRFAAVFDDVLELAQEGSEQAWAHLYGSYAGPVRAYVALRGAKDADDLVGEVFVQIARNLPRFEGGEAEFRSWLFMIAHNRLVDERRRLARRPAVSVAEHDEDAVAVAPDAEGQALEALGFDNVRALIARLTPDQRTVLLLRFVGDLTLEEISTVMGRPLGAVKQLQRRALRSLKRSLVAADVPQ